MATLRDIRRRIASVQNTQKITRAMKLVAAAKLRRAQERVLESRPYAALMTHMAEDVAVRAPRDAHPLLREGRLLEAEGGPHKLILVVSGDRGLCGAFNSNVIRRSLELVRAGEREHVALSLIVVGRKVRDFYKKREVAVRSEYIQIFDKLAFAHAQQIGQEVAAAFTAGEVDAVDLVYNEFRSVVSQRVVTQRLLPLPVPAGDEAPEEFIFEPSPAAILEQLLPRHVETQVYRALMESVAAEYGARMTAMDNATKNASEVIELLTIQFNKARQERITRELLEIVGGAEALRQR
jgi:F-type H+-transporting ATPase subunit gamma